MRSRRSSVKKFKQAITDFIIIYNQKVVPLEQLKNNKSYHPIANAQTPMPKGRLQGMQLIAHFSHRMSLLNIELKELHQFDCFTLQ